MASLPPPLPLTSPSGQGRSTVAAVRRTEPLLLVACGLVSIVSAYLPWAAVSASFIDTVRKAGVDGDGRVTLVLGGALAALGCSALLRPARRRGAGLIGLLVAIVITAVALVNVADYRSAAGQLSAEARALVDLSVGSGLWLTLVAGMTGVGAGILMVLADGAGPAGRPQK